MAADPKPARRHKADIDEWKILRKLKLGPCRVCDSTRWLTLHHLVGRDLGGDDLPNNLVPLCVPCHQLVEERSRITCEMLRHALTLNELAYVLVVKGERFLSIYYPRRSVEDMQTEKETDQSAA